MDEDEFIKDKSLTKSIYFCFCYNTDKNNVIELFGSIPVSLNYVYYAWLLLVKFI